MVHGQRMKRLDFGCNRTGVGWKSFLEEFNRRDIYSGKGCSCVPRTCGLTDLRLKNELKAALAQVQASGLSKCVLKKLRFL